MSERVKLDELHALVQEQLSGHASADSFTKLLLRADRIARWVADTLPSDAGCGAVEPLVYLDQQLDGMRVSIPDEWPGVYTAEEARGLARLLLVAAERAEAK